MSNHRIPSPQVNMQAAGIAPSDNHTLRVLLEKREIERKPENEIGA
jgi:hypothetical protein